MNGRLGEYASMYWAAACLAFWAGCGATDAQLSDAVAMVCDGAGLTVPQEALLTRLLHDMLKGGRNGGD